MTHLIDVVVQNIIANKVNREFVGVHILPELVIVRGHKQFIIKGDIVKEVVIKVKVIIEVIVSACTINTLATLVIN